MTSGLRYDAYLFDKDGTLVDFAATWDEVVGEALRASTADDAAFIAAADAIGFDHHARRVLPGSVFIAEPWTVVAEVTAGLVDVSVFGAELQRLGADHAVPMRGLAATVEALAAQPAGLAVVTNDGADLAQRQLESLSVDHLFDIVLGFDSVARPKPAPDMLVAAADHLGVDPRRCLVIGDSAHDLAAARRASMDSALIGSADVGAELPTHRIDNLADLLAL